MAKVVGKTGPQYIPRGAPRPFSEITLLAFAFCVAFFIWLIAKREEADSDVIQVPVRLLGVPEYIEARVEPTQVQVALRFPRALKSEIVSENFFIGVDFAPRMEREALSGGEFPGLLEFRKQVLSLDSADFSRVEDANVPTNQIHVERYRPTDIYIEARYRGRMVPVEPRFEGRPAEDFQLNQERVQVKPPEVFIAGPPGALEGLEKVFATVIDIENRRYSFAQKNAALDLPRALQEVPRNQSATVEVAVVIEPVTGERLVEDVPFWAPIIAQNVDLRSDPPAVGVLVRGPKTLLADLETSSFEFFLKEDIEEVSGRVYEGVPYDAKVRREVFRAKEGVYEVVGVVPERLDIEFVPVGAPGAAEAPAP